MREALLTRLREALERRRWDYRRVAERTGLHPRTVRRLLEGRSFSLSTAERVSRALGVDSNAPAAVHDGAARGNAGQDGAGLSPVVGWEQAARSLGVSRWTLRRWRGHVTVRPWWASPVALREWFEGVVAQSNSERSTGGIT